MSLDRLWSPWRMAYVGGKQPEGCIFCAALAGPDEDGWVVQRAERAFVMLNAFPYNPGHVMVAPRRHVADLSGLEPAELADLFSLVARAIEVLRATLSPEGFNVGMNLGRVAGAGIPGHLHVHVVPRWGGDTNFMPVVGQTKVLPEMLADTYAKLRPAFAGQG